jgi:hypothetical protein
VGSAPLAVSSAIDRPELASFGHIIWLRSARSFGFVLLGGEIGADLDCQGDLNR